MVHPQEDRNNTLQQGREPEHRDEPLRQAGRQPYPGEVIGGRREPPFEVTGLDALSPILQEVRFPATKEEVIAQIGHAIIPLDRTETASVAEVLRETAPREFRSSAEVESAVKQVWDRLRPHGEEGRGAHHRQRDNVTGRPPN